MKDRLLALDVFRGLTVALMILVNNPGSWGHIYPPLRHARWHGWTPTDLVFPFFLFIVGVAISLSFARRQELGAGRGDLLRKIGGRAVIIFGLGLFLNGFPFTGGAELWETFRIWGVLQRIAVCYLAVGLLAVLVPDHRGRLLWGLGLLAVYEVGMRGVGGGSFALADNFARRLDVALWGEAHLWQGAGLPFDPEGLWTTLPAVVTTLAGYFCGEFLRSGRPLGSKVARLAMWGLAGAAAGQALHGIEPVNKQLWTVSYVVLTGGLALLLLAFALWALDIRGWRGWAKPAVVFGSNALVVFVGSGMLARLLFLIKVPAGEGGISLKHFIYSRLLVPWAGELNGSLAYAVLFILLWLGVLWVLYRRRIFIRV